MKYVIDILTSHYRTYNIDITQKHTFPLLSYLTYLLFTVRPSPLIFLNLSLPVSVSLSIYFFFSFFPSFFHSLFISLFYLSVSHYISLSPPLSPPLSFSLFFSLLFLYSLPLSPTTIHSNSQMMTFPSLVLI